MDVSIEQAAKVIDRVAALKPEEATRLNTWLRDAAYLERAEISAGYPGIFEIEPTNLCAMRCVHCPRPTELRRPGMHMPPDLLALVASQVRSYAQDLYSASGDTMLVVNLMHYGEPALTPHYEKAVRLLRSRGVRVVSSSTSSAFSKKAAKAAVRSGLDELWLIFDGMDDETFQRMRGPLAGFEAGLERLRGLQAAKAESGADAPAISVMMIRHPYNRHQWSAFDDFFKDWPDVRHYLAAFSTFSGRLPSLLSFLDDLMDDPATRAEQSRVAEINAHPCRYPWHSVCVLSDGRVVPCCRDINGDMILGDLKAQSLIDIWNGPALRELRKRFAAGDRNNPLCRNCREASLEIGAPPRLDPLGPEARRLVKEEGMEVNA